MAKKIGGIGAIGYAGYQMISQVPEQARKATEVSTSAKNMGMSVEEGTRLTGTLIQKGSTEDDARQSFESLYGSLNDAVRGNNNELLATIRSIGASIIQREDGSVDLTKHYSAWKKPSRTFRKVATLNCKASLSYLRRCLLCSVKGIYRRD
ncbi:hypothetical protein [Morganella morganii]|uniref:hypothetical protein n=1 Tax=Morganella morganii TaxID=582 RepID=UPI000BFD01AC|nr:hypothetical protein [Morganella morganii]PHH07153.1 hypothetical protein CRX48_21885 [Morganella morganii]